MSARGRPIAVLGPNPIVEGHFDADRLKLIGDNFRRAYPVDESAFFTKLLRDIDEADTISTRGS